VRPAAALAERLGLLVGDPDLLEQALVHTSYLHEHPDAAAGHNERLEFLGDAVVNLAISEALFAAHPNDDEGVLSARRAAIVSTVGLARLAHRIDLGSMLFLGEGEAKRGGRRRPSIIASAFEALCGALYLDLGYDATKTWLLELAAPEIALSAPASSLKSPKSRLQEFTQRETGARPEYRVVDSSGPDHEKQFQVEVVVGGRVLGIGTGPSRRIAETVAAQRAIEVLRRDKGFRSGPPAGAEAAGDQPIDAEPPAPDAGSDVPAASEDPARGPTSGAPVAPVALRTVGRRR
jgi:ribonuclease III